MAGSGKGGRGSLYVWVLIAIAAGAALGFFFPQTGAAMKPLSDGFIKLVKMIIAPVIFCTVALGIAGAEGLKKVGRTGTLALVYFEAASTLALVVGLIVVNVVQPGAGVNANPKTLDTGAVAAYTGHKMESVPDFLLNVIPATFVDAFAKGEIPQVLLLAILFGIAVQHLRAHRGPVLNFVQDLSNIWFEIVRLIMYAAPIGAFGAMAFTIGNFGLKALGPLAKLMGCFYLTCLIFVFLGLGTIARAHGFNIFRFVRYIREELLLVLATSSSEAALPSLMAKLEKLGAGRATVGLVIPAGYSFNLDGTAIYLTIAAVFIAQATNTPLSLRQQLVLLAVLLLTSKGAAGVTGSGFIVLAATLSAVGNVPVGGLALILGIDRFMSEARALTNIVGNGVATLIVAKWTGDLDQTALLHELAAGPEPKEDKEEVFAR